MGFFTKYGDGGVDLSPIADLTKTEVYEVARELRIIPSIIQAAPTDGLFGDSRTDEDQIGANYPELEWAMDLRERKVDTATLALSDRQRQVLAIFDQRHAANRHKIIPIPHFVGTFLQLGAGMHENALRPELKPTTGK